MAEDEIPTSEDEYELLPHKEIEDLKDELAKLKEFEIAPSKKLQVSLLELNTKLDKLITIFEDATHELRIEEGALSFTEKMRPILEKMNKILEQNSEIASGILALADMVKDIKEKPEAKIEIETQTLMPMPAQYMPMPPMPAQQMPMPAPMHAPLMMAPPRQAPPIGPMPPGVPPGMPLPPMPPRRRTFGL